MISGCKVSKKMHVNKVILILFSLIALSLYSQTNDIFITFQLTEPIGTRWVASLDNGQDFFFCDPNSDNPSIDDHYVPGGYAGDTEVTIRIKAFSEYNPETPQQVRFAIRVLSPEGTWNRLVIDEDKQTGGAEDYILIKQVAD